MKASRFSTCPSIRPRSQRQGIQGNGVDLSVAAVRVVERLTRSGQLSESLMRLCLGTRYIALKGKARECMDGDCARVDCWMAGKGRCGSATWR